MGASCRWSLATQQRCPNQQGDTRAHCIVANKTVSQSNCFMGTLSKKGMRVLLALTFFSIGGNSFTGMVPESGLREVTDFRIQKNHFAGALPDGGMRAMLA
eukprot:5764081-Amphidinium_carterae.1